jgi:O-antigen ligase
VSAAERRRGTTNLPSSTLPAARHDRAARIFNVDLLAVVAAVLLPWTTTGLAIAMALWIVAVLFTLQRTDFLHSLWHPAALLPIAFFLLADIGTLWSDAPWPARLHGISPAAKLLAIPFLLYHFQRTQRGHWVLIGFVVSCALLMALSTIVLFIPAWKLGSSIAPGVAVKNYLDQDQEFTFCVFALALPAQVLWRQGRHAAAALCVALMLGFLVNMVFVVTARTALVLVPVLLVLFAVRHFSARTTLILLAACAIVAVTAWFGSPNLRERVLRTAAEYQGYQGNFLYPVPNSTVPDYRPNSTGLRIEYWKKSLRFFREAPVVGHGTGSIGRLFEQDAVGKSGLEAEVVNNPHNQTLSVAVQWGTVGIVLLYGLWLSHLMLFRGGGLAGWTGLLVVVQNVVSSLFNSHLFDFVEGWIYVLGVGVAGGMVIGASKVASGMVRPETSGAGAPEHGSAGSV